MLQGTSTIRHLSTSTGTSDYERILEFLFPVQPEQQTIPISRQSGRRRPEFEHIAAGKDREFVVYVNYQGIQLFGYVAGLTAEAVRLNAIDEAGRQNGHLVGKVGTLLAPSIATHSTKGALDILHKSFAAGGD